MTTEIVYKGHDNKINLLLKAKGSAVNLSSVTKMELKIGPMLVTSDITPSAFDWTSGSTGEVILDLGDSNLRRGSYQTWLIVYDPNNPDGIVWGSFTLIVENV